MKPILPCIFLDSNAEEAVAYYLAVFPGGKILTREHYTKATEDVSGKPAGTIMAIHFEIDGNAFLALNGGSEMPNNGAVSFIVNCDTQADIDYYWSRLSAGGTELECGWLRDRFGVTWQIAPSRWAEVFTAANAAKQDRMMTAMIKMKKLDLEALLNA